MLEVCVRRIGLYAIDKAKCQSKQFVSEALFWRYVVMKPAYFFDVCPVERFDAFTHNRFCFFGPHLFFGVADKEYACCVVAVGCWLDDLKGVALA
jgi:hypothetical protein